MRHLKSGRHLNRTSSHRKQMFANMCVSLIEHEIIKTTVPKAKELRRFFEPLVTRAATDSVANRRLAFAFLRNRDAVTKLYEEIGPRFTKRPGGYTRILKAGHRNGDAAMIAYIELVDRRKADDPDAWRPDEAVEQVPELEAEPPAEIEGSESTEAAAEDSKASEEAAEQEAPAKEEEMKRSQWWKIRNPWKRRGR